MYLNFYKKLTILFAWFLLAIVLLLSPMPLNDSQEAVTYVDKVVHAFLFGVFVFLIFFTFAVNNHSLLIVNPERNSRKTKKDKINKTTESDVSYFKRNLLIAILSGIFFSMITECAQILVPGRSPSHYDFLASLVGIILSVILIYGTYNEK